MARAAVQQISYQDLYKRWEEGNWKSSDLDFTEDRKHWHETWDDVKRRGALWNYSMFFHGEDSVAENLTPYIDAAPREEQKYFLATQQVDEARHAVFFARFMKEVVERGDDINSSLQSTYPELSWGFRKTFERLDRMADELRKDRSKPKLAEAITLYHLIIEASLAQPGQHFIEDYLEKEQVMPGFRAGMRNVSRDEQRHIGFGVKLLSDLKDEDPEVPHAVAAILREVIPWATAVFVPPNWDERYVTCFGSTLEEVFASGVESLDQKLRAAGMPPEELPGGVPLDTHLSPEERAHRGMVFLRSGILGEKNGPPSIDPEVLDEYFDSIRAALGAKHPVDAPPVTLQWDFRDTEPWFLRLDNGTSEASRGRLEDADIRFDCRFEDWVDVTMGRENPLRALATGKLRPKGSLRTLWRERELFSR
jgi:hypothetical protein